MASPNWSQRALATLFGADPAGTDPTIPETGLVAGPSSAIVEPAAAGFGITFHPSTWLVAGGAPATVGASLWCPPGDVTKTVTAADPTFDRHDLVTLQVTDPGSSSTAGQTDVVIVTGVAASSPGDPSVPTGAEVVARIRVRAGSSTIVQSDIDDLRNLARLRNDLQRFGVTGTVVTSSGLGAITVTFDEPFPAGTVPVVIPVVLSSGTFHLTCEVIANTISNTGFQVRVSAGGAYALSTACQILYVAALA